MILDADRPFAERLEEAFVYVVTSTRSAPNRQAIALATADPADGWGTVDPEGRIMGEVLDFLRPRLAAGAAETPFRAGVDETLTWLLRQVQLYLLVPARLRRRRRRPAPRGAHLPAARRAGVTAAVAGLESAPWGTSPNG